MVVVVLHGKAFHIKDKTQKKNSYPCIECQQHKITTSIILLLSFCYPQTLGSHPTDSETQTPGSQVRALGKITEKCWVLIYSAPLWISVSHTVRFTVCAVGLALPPPLMACCESQSKPVMSQVAPPQCHVGFHSTELKLEQLFFCTALKQMVSAPFLKYNVFT